MIEEKTTRIDGSSENTGLAAVAAGFYLKPFFLEAEVMEKDELPLLARRLRIARVTSGLSLTAAAFDIPTAGKLEEYEAGEAEPLADELVPLCRLYNVSLDWLAGLTDRMRIPKPKELSQHRAI